MSSFDSYNNYKYRQSPPDNSDFNIPPIDSYNSYSLNTLSQSNKIPYISMSPKITNSDYTTLNNSRIPTISSQYGSTEISPLSADIPPSRSISQSRELSPSQYGSRELSPSRAILQSQYRSRDLSPSQYGSISPSSRTISPSSTKLSQGSISPSQYGSRELSPSASSREISQYGSRELSPSASKYGSRELSQREISQRDISRELSQREISRELSAGSREISQYGSRELSPSSREISESVSKYGSISKYRNNEREMEKAPPRFATRERNEYERENNNKIKNYNNMEDNSYVTYNNVKEKGKEEKEEEKNWLEEKKKIENTLKIKKLENNNIEFRNYEGLIKDNNLETELIEKGYAPLSKIIIEKNGNRKTTYIKAINTLGQKVFILIDVNGFTSTNANDMILVESDNATIVPYSLKTGAYDCAKYELCGIAFECSSDSICVLTRGNNDLKPIEKNFVLINDTKKNEKYGKYSDENNDDLGIMTYPVVLFSEIRENPQAILENTRLVTSRLRNESYISLVDKLKNTNILIDYLTSSFKEFEIIRENIANKLNNALSELEIWNNEYLKNPPLSDENKTKFRLLKHNLVIRNENIETLLRCMKKVTDLNTSIKNITNDISDVVDFSKTEFANVDKVIPN